MRKLLITLLLLVPCVALAFPPPVFVPSPTAPVPVFHPGTGTGGGVGPAGPTGPQGPKGDKGDKGDTGATGPAGIAGAAGSSGGGAGVGVLASLSGVSSSTSDNASALATAWTAAQSAHSHRIYLPSGVLNENTPWTLSTTDVQSGPLILGAGPSASGQSTDGGTSIHLQAAGQTAVLVYGTGKMLQGSISDLTLVGYNPNSPTLDTDAGMLFSDTHWTMARISNVQMKHVGTAIKVRTVANQDGENLAISDVLANEVNCLYDNGAGGQNYGDSLYNCTATINQGGTALILGSAGGGGYQFASYGTSVSFSSPILGNTFLHVYGGIDSAAIQSTRAEKCGKIIVLEGGSPTLRSKIVVENSTFTALPDGGLIVSGAGTNSQHDITFSHCRFAASVVATSTTGNTVHLASMGGGGYDRITFIDCNFEDFHVIDAGTKPVGSTYAGVVLTNCWRDDLQGGAVLTALTN